MSYCIAPEEQALAAFAGISPMAEPNRWRRMENVYDAMYCGLRDRGAEKPECLFEVYIQGSKGRGVGVRDDSPLVVAVRTRQYGTKRFVERKSGVNLGAAISMALVAEKERRAQRRMLRDLERVRERAFVLNEKYGLVSGAGVYVSAGKRASSFDVHGLTEEQACRVIELLQSEES